MKMKKMKLASLHKNDITKIKEVLRVKPGERIQHMLSLGSSGKADDRVYWDSFFAQDLTISICIMTSEIDIDRDVYDASMTFETLIELAGVIKSIKDGK